MELLKKLWVKIEDFKLDHGDDWAVYVALLAILVGYIFYLVGMSSVGVVVAIIIVMVAAWLEY